MSRIHYSVLREEVLNSFKEVENLKIVIDGTTGEGGHSLSFVENFSHINLHCLDRDKDILKKASLTLQDYQSRVTFHNVWNNDFFKEYPLTEKADAIIFDLGISMFHYKESQRGFSFLAQEPLDMRLNHDGEISAFTIINEYSEEEIADIFYYYGEERLSRVFARKIVEFRSEKEIQTSKELADIIYKASPSHYRYKKIHPATRSFQALRIKVNKELERLEDLLKYPFENLSTGGVLSFITFHSLEDRLVKRYFRSLVDDKKAVFLYNKRKPIMPSQEEINENSASRSSKLRSVKKIV